MLAFLKSFRFAWQGIKYAWRGRNFRVQCASAFAVFFLGMYFNIRPTEWLAIIIISSFVLAFEIVNTAIEHLVDFFYTQ